MIPTILLGLSAGEIALLMAAVGVVFLLLFGIMLAKRYKRCPPNRILVIYGKKGGAQTPAKCLHGGGAFVWPLVQSYAYLSLDPLQIEIPLSDALSAENIRINVPSVFTVAIGDTEQAMNNAANRLLGLSQDEIAAQGRDIIFGQLRQVIASMRIEEINRDRDTFLSSIQSSLEPELAKLGMVLINVNITDITDGSGYIEAIGRKAASEAIQQAEIDVAQQRKHGAIGVAQALREQEVMVAQAEKERQVGTTTAQRTQAVEVARLEKEREVGEKQEAYLQRAQVKDAERQMRIDVAAADASAVAGENESKAKVAQVNAELRVKEAEAYQFSESRKREAEAAVLEAQYKAEARAALAEGEKVEAEQRAALESTARAEKAKITVDAEAIAAAKRIDADAEAQAQFVKLEAQARGQYEMLRRKAEGLRDIVSSCGGPQEAFQMLMLEHLDHLAETAASAIANVKFDKVIVWDGGGEDSSGTANFVKKLAGMLPPMMNIMKDIGGVEMPEFFGKLVDPSTNGPARPTPVPAGDPTTSKGDDTSPVVERAKGAPPPKTAKGDVASRD